MKLAIKLLLLCLSLLEFQLSTDAQLFQAEYKVEMAYPVDNGKGSIIVPYKGLYYSLGTKSISWLDPDFLEENPNGIFKYKESEISFSSNLQQQLVYVNRDSMLIRHNADGRMNYLQSFEPELYIWQLEPELKLIKGFTCKKLLYRKKSDGPILGEIWYFSDIQMPVGLMMMIGLPGLMVEWEVYGFLKASLHKYSFQENLSEKIFWPDVFNKPFKELPPFKRAIIN
jgi:GLPGLI family protein